MIGRCCRVAAVAASTALIAAPAGAQLTVDPPTVVIPPVPIDRPPSAFDRTRNIPVIERMLPAFTAQGVTLGNFELYPALAVAPFYSSNVFANNDRRADDLAVAIRPDVTLRTTAGQYRVALRARGDVRQFTTYTSENTEEGLVSLDGAADFGALNELSAGVTYGSLIQSRRAADTPAEAAKPLEYETIEAYGNARIESGRIRLTARGDVAQFRFRDAPGRDGGMLFTRDRDRTRSQLLVRGEVAVSPAVSFYGAGSVNRIDYRFDSTAGIVDRDSSGFGAFVGSSFDLTDFVRGDVRVGYIRQNFRQGDVPPIEGLGLVGLVEYFPTRLTTVTLRASSTVEDSGVPGTTGFLRRGGSARVDHEFRRYIVGTVEGGYFRDTYRGLPRRDDLPFLRASGTYLSGNHWNARVGYEFAARDCRCVAGVRPFDEHRLNATLTFQY